MKAPQLFLNFRARASVALVIGCSALLVPHAVAAQSAPAETMSPQAKYRKAHQAIGAKNWEEARKLLRELWADSQTYDVAVSLGQVEFWLKHYADGARYLAFALQNIPPAEKVETVDRVKAGLNELKEHVGSVKVTVSERDADVFVDGKLEGKSPLGAEVYVDPGAHHFEAKLGAAPPSEATLEAVAGETYSVELRLEPATPAVAPATQAQPDPAGDQPPAKAEPARGAKSAVPLYVAGGVVVAGAALGIGFTVAAGNSTDHIDELRAQVGTDGCVGVQSQACQDLADTLESRDRQRNISYASFAVAGGALVAGAVYYFWRSRSKQSSSVGVTWLPGGTLVTLRGAL